MNDLIAAVAHELAMHVEDLVDTYEAEMANEEGDAVGTLLDTNDAEDLASFIIVVSGGRKLAVTVTEVFG